MLTKNKNRALSLFLILNTLIVIKFALAWVLPEYPMNMYSMTEWLVNYQGGFTRRGLPGEVFYQLYNYFGISPYYSIKGLAIVTEIIVVLVFVYSFVKKGYPLLFLPLTVFFGGPIILGSWLRKDSLTMLLLIAIFYIFSKEKREWLKYILVNLLFILGVLIHEVIFFIGMPMLMVLIVNEIKESNLNLKIKDILMALPKACLYVLPTFVAFLLVSIYSGNEAVANDIINSWDVNAFPYPPDPLIKFSAIDGLKWTIEHNFKITMNNYFMQGRDVVPIISVGLLLFVIYYVISNLGRLNFKFFRYMPKNFDGEVVRNVLMFQTVFVMLPLLLIGCDTGRWVFLWVGSTFAILCVVPELILQKSFPIRFIGITRKMNNGITSFLGNSRGVVILLAILPGIIEAPGAHNLLHYIVFSPLYMVLKSMSLIPAYILDQI